MYAQLLCVGSDRADSVVLILHAMVDVVLDGVEKCGSLPLNYFEFSTLC